MVREASQFEPAMKTHGGVRPHNFDCHCLSYIKITAGSRGY